MEIFKWPFTLINGRMARGEKYVLDRFELLKGFAYHRRERYFKIPKKDLDNDGGKRSQTELEKFLN